MNIWIKLKWAKTSLSPLRLIWDYQKLIKKLFLYELQDYGLNITDGSITWVWYAR